MRLTSLAVPLTVACILTFGAGCSSTSNNAGSGGLSTAPATVGSTAPQPSGTHTAAAPTATHTTPATTKTQPAAPQWPTPGDCVSYNPATLTVDGSGSTGTFVVSSGSTVVMRLHGQDDQVGQQALALAQRYREHCYIGRNNNRGEDKGDYIFDYWRNPSGNTPTIPDPDDNLCREYNNHNLTVEDMGDGDGWRVKDHDDVLHKFDNQTDARNGNLVLLKYSHICSIGDSDSSDNDLGQVTYFQ